MIYWPWLIAAFAAGGIASLAGAFAWLTGGLREQDIYAFKAIQDWAVNHPDEVEARANLMSGGTAFPSKTQMAGMWAYELGSDGVRLAMMGEQETIRRIKRGIRKPHVEENP